MTVEVYVITNHTLKINLSSCRWKWWWSHLPTLVLVYAGQCHSFCRILLAFAGQYCMTVLLAENLDTLKLITS